MSRRLLSQFTHAITISRPTNRLGKTRSALLGVEVLEDRTTPSIDPGVAFSFGGGANDQIAARPCKNHVHR